MRFAAFVERLERALSAGPPGVEGQLAMSPRPRFGWSPGQVSPDARPGAALALWYPLRDEPYLLLTVRDGALPQHAGQVSLPGGGVEPGESVEQAALREAHEEVAVDPSAVRTVGRLSALDVPVSRYVVRPVVGVAASRPAFVPRPGEVERVVEAPWSALSDPSTLRVDVRQRRGRDVEVPSFAIDGVRVWGATAMILAELLVALGEPPAPWG